MGFVAKIIILTFNDAEEKAVEEAIAALAKMIPLEAVQPPHSPKLIFPGLEIRLHQRRVLKDGADISLIRLEYGALCYLAASPGRGQIKSATVLQVPSGKYFVSVLVETEHEEMPHTKKNTGLDLGIKDLCITSDGTKYENPKTNKKYEKKLAKLQRQLSHKEKRSHNYYKQKKKIALCHEKIKNTRKDHLHKVSHEIVSENQVIVSENLQIRNMVKNHHLSKSVPDASWYEPTRLRI